MTRFTDRMTLDGGLRQTEDGWVAQARVARGGNVQTYVGSEIGMADRALVRIYRPAEEVFDRSAIQTYARKPITLGHPPGGVSPETWKDRAIGEIDRDVLRDGEFVSVPLLFRDARAVDVIRAADGPRELSMGYDADLSFEDGTAPGGETYDAVMRNFRMNHVAVVPVARGGHDLRIGDGADNWGAAPVHDAARKEPPMTEQLRTIMVDGLSVATTDAGAQAIEKLTRQLADATTRHDAAMAARDAEHATEIAAKDAAIAKAEGERDAALAKVLSDEALDKRVADRAALIATAKAIAPEVETKGLADAAIRKAVVVAKLGDAMSAKSDAYIDARFEILAEDAKPADKVADALSTGPHVKADDATTARAEYIKRLADAHRTTQEA